MLSFVLEGFPWLPTTGTLKHPILPQTSGVMSYVSGKLEGAGKVNRITKGSLRLGPLSQGLNHHLSHPSL